MSSRKNSLFTRSALAVLLLGATLGGAAPAETAITQTGFAPLVAKVKPAVVNIATAELRRESGAEIPPTLPEPFRQFFDQRQRGPQNALGSGFLIDPAGYIVTNNHVITNARKITVTLDDGSVFTAKPVGHDEKTDLALLKIDSDHPLPFVSFGSSAAEQVGDWVIAVGNPFGLGGTVTAGIISAHGRNINEGPYDDFLQIDAPINPGNSGGPLFNQQGQVIGIDSNIYSPNGGSVGIGFAIPSDLASHIITELREHGEVRRGWLGVQMQPVSETLAKAVGLSKPQGVLVDEIQPDSPASRAKMLQGDVILSFDGMAIKTPRDLALAVAKAHEGQTAHLVLWRDGREKTIDVTLTAQKKPQLAKLDAKDGDALGLALAPLTRQSRSELGLKPDARGVLVREVAEDSAAEASGLLPGDIIQRVGDHEVTSPDDATRQIQAAEQAKKTALPLLVSRNGTSYYVALQLIAG